MLPAAHRLRRSGDFAVTVRRGRRVARGCVVVHLLRPTPDSAVSHDGALVPVGAPDRGVAAARPGERVGVTLDTSIVSAIGSSAPVDAADERARMAAGPVDLGGELAAGPADLGGERARGARRPDPGLPADPGPSVGEPARAGFVVSKAVGGAVVRNRVKRRLRHLMAERIDRLPHGATVVVRAQPSAALRRYQEMALDLENALDAALRSGRRQ